jgi:hypothetical protein
MPPLRRTAGHSAGRQLADAHYNLSHLREDGHQAALRICATRDLIG